MKKFAGFFPSRTRILFMAVAAARGVFGLWLLSSSAFAGCVEWVKRTDVGSPGLRYSHAMAYDSDRSVTVLFGGEFSSPGESDFIFFNDTWEYDGVQWRKINVANIAGSRPSPRSGHAIAYDAARKQVLLFGGAYSYVAIGGTSTTYFNDAWAYQSDGTNGTWTLLPQATPPRRAHHMMIYDSARQVVVMHGGTDVLTPGIESILGDTWEWNGAGWLRTGFSPDRTRQAGAFDSLSGKIIMFGGAASDGFPSHPAFLVSGTFEYPGSDGSLWRQLPGQSPAPRHWHAMAFDPRRGKVVMFGGVSDDTPGIGDDTDEYTPGVGWTSVISGGPGQPPSRGRHAMVYDRKRGRMVLYGGVGGDPRYDDTWELVTLGPTFTEFPQDQKVEPCSMATFHVAVAGDPPHIFQWFKGTNTLTTDGRISGTESGTLHIRQVGYADEGIYHAQVTSSCGTNISSGAELKIVPAWTLITESGPGPVSDHAMAYDSDQRVTVLFNGSFNVAPRKSETWEYSSGSWVLRSSTGPSPRNVASLSYDSDRKRMVLFGGEIDIQVFSDQTWEWDGNSWSKIATPGPNPSPRSGAGLCYDPVTKRTILHGGWGNPSGSILHDTWEFDGKNWTLATSEPPLGALVGNGQRAKLVFDPKRQKRVLLDSFVALAYEAAIRVFEWDNSTNNWVFKSPVPDFTGGVSRIPGPRFEFAAAYNPNRGQVIINNGRDGFGTVYQDTWGYDGTYWKLIVEGAGPPAAGFGQVVYDEARRTLVQIGGYTGPRQFGDTWELTDTDVVSVLQQPTVQNVAAGQSVRMSVRASGAPPLQYQWFRNAIPVVDGGTISGAQTSSLLIRSTRIIDAGDYHVSIQNACGIAASSLTKLDVQVPLIPISLPAKTNLVSWWNGEGTAADGQRFQDGTLQNGVAFVNGRIGQAFSFDGVDDFVRVPHQAEYNPSGAFSVQVWINASSKQLNPESQSLVVDKSHGGVIAIGWFLQTTPDGKIAFGFGSGGDGFVASNYPLAASRVSVMDEIWHLVTGVWDGTQIMLYLDGVLHETTASARGPAGNDRDIFIGAWWGGGGVAPRWHFRGYIDEVMYFNRALTTAEVEATFKSTLPEGSPELKYQTSSSGTVTLSWTNTKALLDEAPEVLGPWKEVTGAASPFFVQRNTGVSRKFFRLRVP
jgi:hypothetical protein